MAAGGSVGSWPKSALSGLDAVTPAAAWCRHERFSRHLWHLPRDYELAIRWLRPSFLTRDHWTPGRKGPVSMELRLYDTLTRQKRTFVPLDPAHVRMYVCGPTVYDFAHIGNARPVIVFDVLFRLLRHIYGEDHVTYVRNITDVDDKINDRAVRDFPGLPLNEAIRKVTEVTAAQFSSDVAALRSLSPTFEPRATDFVLPRGDGKADMVTLIKQLIARGHAYEAGGEVLFDVQSMPDYGMLSGRKLDEQRPGARVAVDAHQKSPLDFVFWKESSDDAPGWANPWGRGRPGWH